MEAVLFPVCLELDGWDLLWFHVELVAGREEALAALRRGVSEGARSRFAPESLSADPTVAALRSLFRAAGCDPTRYRPSSEALLRRVLKGEDLPVIHPLVDLNNCLSVALAVPCCVVAEGSFTPPVVLRAGRAGESYESLRGPFNLEGKPLLADASGPFGTPITDSQRVKVREGDRRAWMVAYLPRGVVTAEAGRSALDDLLATAAVARLEESGVSQ
ncbi:MAG TPA: phenylalanine--tRNA ligase beta subunit-related protein [Thermoanaerobaculia bacterium]|jgi:DNA/RNA-binding domain of Phe-tRNA-synthetase-like protein|nr:phenylalanine--tRNA ligase beta subunit-related protein [Thermoanaerobaculia bacterium]